MKRISERTRSTAAETLYIARRGVAEIEGLTRTLASGAVADVQQWLRVELLSVEQQLVSWTGRRRRRRDWIRRYRHKSGPTRAVNDHLQSVNAYEAALRHKRAVIRQIADAVAWLVLRRDVRLVRSLYADRSNFLPTGRGLASTAQVVNELNATGKLIAVQNDLTRCLGDGDITVVRYGSSWQLPVTYELKSPGEDRPLQVGEVVDINFTAVHTGHPDQLRLIDEVATLIEGNDGHVGRCSASLRRQEKGMRERAELLFEMTRPKELLAEGSNHWDVVSDVIKNSNRPERFAIVEAEPGLVYAVTRRSNPDDGDGPLHRMLDAVQEIMPLGSDLLSTARLATDNHLSALVIPVALWPIEAGYRSDILAGDLGFFAMMRDDLWQTALAQRG